jgi:hypothetical protein
MVIEAIVLESNPGKERLHGKGEHLFGNHGAIEVRVDEAPCERRKIVLIQ